MTPHGDGSTLAVTLHTEHESDEINHGIDETLDNVKALVADRPSIQS